MKQTIKIDQLAPSLNKWQRMHWAKRTKVKNKWKWLIRSENPKKHDGAVHITYTRVSTQPMDLDNVAGSFKAIGDALVKGGIIEDDNPAIVQSLTVQWQKAESHKLQHSIIEIEDAK